MRIAGSKSSLACALCAGLLAFAAYGTAALSMRIAGPVRMAVDGVFGSTFSRLVVRTQGIDRAYWGAPFGALALRLEALFQ